MQAAWEVALREAKATAERWSEEIRERTKSAARELADVDTAKWEFPERADPENSRAPLCKVAISAKFRSQPVLLDRIGLSGELYGQPDLSRAVGEPKVRQSMGATMVEWQEPDDGRVGEVLITLRVDHLGPQRPKRLPIPKLCVHAEHLCYD